LLAHLGAYISPVHFSVVSFLGFGFPLFWILNLLFAIYWILKRKKRLLLSLVFLVITWGQWKAVFQLNANKEIKDPTSTLSVMSYNVRMFDRYNWTGDEDNIEKMFAYIKDKNPDILCIQEFYVDNRYSKYAENNIMVNFMHYKYKYVEYFSKSKGGPKSGLAIFSNYPIENKKPLYFSNTSNFTILSDVNVNGKVIRIFNNHLESNRLRRENYNFIDSLTYKNDEERRKGVTDIIQKMNNAFRLRANQAESISKHIKGSPYPVIVCGDFNDTSVSYVYREVKGNLKDTFIESGKGFGGTYNGKLPSFRIDFIFHDNSFNTIQYIREKVEYSDHYPIMAVLDLSSKE
jgi:endonuclease/exonuclease/phosphatase family metal-dependent hydrolase